MKTAALWLLALILRRFGLRAAPQLIDDHRSCTFCAGPVCRACRLTIRYAAVDGEFCSDRCKRIETEARVADHVVQPFTDAFADIDFSEER